MAETLAAGTLPQQINLSIVDDKVPNAFALPGGYVLLHSGFIQQAESAEEVAGVLAHEIGHVYYQHSLQRIIHHLGVSLLVDFATGGGGTFTFAAVTLLGNAYSRDAEAEADAYAAEVMTQHGYSLDGMEAFFARQSEEEKSEWMERFNWLSTHPADASRVAFLQTYPKAKAPKPVMSAAEWKRFQSLEGCGFNAKDD